MGSWITYGVQVEIIAIFLMIYALLVLFKAAINLRSEFSVAIFYILAAMSVEIVQGATIAMLLARRIDPSHPLWAMSPFFGLIGAFVLVLGARKFLYSVQQDMR
jgi:hypothetical protein